MLTKITKSPAQSEDDLDYLLKHLRLKARPRELVDVEAKWRELKSEHAAAVERHREGQRQLSEQQRGGTLTTTFATVDDLARQVVDLEMALTEAKAEHDRRAAVFREEASAELREPVRRYRQALENAIERLDDLIGIGIACDGEAVRHRVPASKVLPLSQSLAVQLRGMRQILNVAGNRD